MNSNLPNNRSFTPDVIRALTPIVLAAIGGVTAVLVIFFSSDQADSAKFVAGMAFAGTAITGSAALAQPGKDSSDKQSTPPDKTEQG